MAGAMISSAVVFRLFFQCTKNLNHLLQSLIEITEELSHFLVILSFLFHPLASRMIHCILLALKIKDKKLFPSKPNCQDPLVLPLALCWHTILTYGVKVTLSAYFSSFTSGSCYLIDFSTTLNALVFPFQKFVVFTSSQEIHTYDHITATVI